jgi:hypothetical protein
MGSPAPTPAPHTPGLFQLAGAAAGISAACAKAVQKCGYDPDDFGKHEQVQKKISDAKDKVQDYNDALKTNKKPMPPKPTAHDAMLARCESGHLTQDRMFHAPGSGTRADPCQNNYPDKGDALGYVSSQAPCMPMLAKGVEGGAKVGSPHWAVGRNEDAQRADPANQGRDLSQKDLGDLSDQNVRLALREDPDSRKDYNAKIRKLKEQAKPGKPDRVQEARERRDEAVAMSQASSKDLKEQGGTGAKDGSKSDDKKKASECIEVFRKFAMAEMRREAIEKYGRDYQKTRDAAAQTHAQAKKDVDDARKALANPKLTPDQRKAEQRKMRDAFRTQQNTPTPEGVDCLNKQIRTMGGRSKPNGNMGPPLPAPGEFKGFNPETQPAS